MDSALVKEGSGRFGGETERRGPGVKPFLVIESMLSLHASCRLQQVSRVQIYRDSKGDHETSKAR